MKKNDAWRQELLEDLLTLYKPETADTALAKIETLLEKYREQIKPEPYSLSEKDIVLITYGNQVVENDEAPLCSLEKFLHENIQDVINTIHILPFFPHSSDSGFSVVDYYRVSPQLGSWREIHTITNQYRLMVDAVVNHVSRYSKWFQSFLMDKMEFCNHFIEVDPSTDLSMVVRPREAPVLSEFSDDRGQRRFLWTTFSKDQIDLNYHCPEVLLNILNILLYYIEHGAKFLRLDAVAYLWKKPGTSCIHMPQTHALVRLFNKVIHQVAPEVVLITETNVEHQKNVSYFGNSNDEAQMVYNFTLPPLLAFAILKEDGACLTRWARTLKLPSDKVCFFNFTASHDGVGVRPLADVMDKTAADFLVEKTLEHDGYISYHKNGGEEKIPYELNCSYMDILSHPDEPDDIRVKRLLLSQALAMAMPGVPGIYFHSLVGSGNYHHGVEKTGQKRAINRERFYLPTIQQELHDTGTVRNMVFNSMKKLLSIRINEKSFNPFGPFEFPALHQAVFAVKQTCIKGNEMILALHNLTSKPVTIKLPQEFIKGVNLFTRRQAVDKDFELEPFEAAWIKKE